MTNHKVYSLAIKCNSMMNDETKAAQTMLYHRKDKYFSKKQRLIRMNGHHWLHMIFVGVSTNMEALN